MDTEAPEAARSDQLAVVHVDTKMAAQLASLRHDIEEVMAPWRAKPSSEKPPFDVKHLVVMALVMSDKEISLQDIVEWIVCALPYYARAMTRAYCQHIPFSQMDLPSSTADRSKQDEGQNNAGRLVEEIVHALQFFDLPLAKSKLPTNYHDVGRSWRTTVSSEARSFLQPVLAPVCRIQNIGFFDLPAEIREHIYDMVFAFPSSGMWSFPQNGWEPEGEPEEKPISFYMSSRSWSESFYYPYAAVNYPDPLNIRTQPVTEILKPLLICRQFHNEAKRNFYRNNRFNFYSDYELDEFLRRMPAARREHIRHLSFEYYGTGWINPPSMSNLALLPSITGLHRLNISRLPKPQTSTNGKMIQQQRVLSSEDREVLRSIATQVTIVVHGCEVLKAEVEALVEEAKGRSRRETEAKRTNAEDTKPENKSAKEIKSKKLRAEEGNARVTRSAATKPRAEDVINDREEIAESSGSRTGASRPKKRAATEDDHEEVLPKPRNRASVSKKRAAKEDDDDEVPPKPKKRKRNARGH